MRRKMGSWGVNIFSNDDAADIRNTYQEKLYLLGEAQAEIETIRECCEYPPNTLWIALAVTEWQYGRLSQVVKQRALDEIKSEINTLAELWKPELVHKRQIILEKTYRQLISQQPKKKSPRKPQWAWKCPWTPGDILQYKLCYPGQGNEEFCGKYVLLPVAAVSKTPAGKIPCETMLIGLCDWIGPTPPTASELSTVKFSGFTFPGGHVSKTIPVSFDSNMVKKADIKCVRTISLCDIHDYFGVNITIPPPRSLYEINIALTFKDKMH